MRESGELNPPCPFCGGRVIKNGYRMTRGRGVVRKYQCTKDGRYFLEPVAKGARA